MPPKPCPECGRFLKNAFVEALVEGGAGCPHCAGTLTASMLADVSIGTSVDDAAGEAVLEAELRAAEAPAAGPMAVPAGGSGHEVSVRPPDLRPDAVRDRSFDVLAGWDVGVGKDEVAAWRRDRRPVPVDTMVVVGGVAVGVVAGLLMAPQHRGRGASLGALSGVLGAATARRVWRLRV